MNIIEISNLNYHFSKKDHVLKDLNIKVPEGALYGLLAANGAGKTTTLRLILGLLKLQTGTIKLFNKDLCIDRSGLLSRIGTLIETPSIYNHLNAYNNLKVWQTIYNCKKERIEQVLQIVGLDNLGHKKAGDFSLGMKQRLSIAIALLNNPEVLILDEPTNGLDPNGIVEIRELLISLNKNFNISIVISSHILSEIEKIATHIGVINNGSIVFEGTLEQLINKQQECNMIEINTPDTGTLLELLNYKNRVFEIGNNNNLRVKVSGQNDIAILIKNLVDNNVNLYEVKQVRDDLESVFMNIIK
ncbi:MAG: ABC transporter ATP-binding protein [Limnohabitans sp.]|nr:ABC transporter ATP-binding protein [Limnohabitans sp.]